MTRRLPQAATGLGQPTIMDRALAAAHGSPYVQLVVFAIDIDRIYTERSTRPDTLPFGWEIMLTEAQLLRVVQHLDPPVALQLAEDACLSVLEQPPDAQGLGSQLVFAAYDALERGKLPAGLRAVFAGWRKPPRQLLTALSGLWPDADRLIPELSATCLAQPLSPGLAEPTRAALLSWVHPGA